MIIGNYIGIGKNIGGIAAYSPPTAELTQANHRLRLNIISSYAFKPAPMEEIICGVKTRQDTITSDTDFQKFEHGIKFNLINTFKI